MRLGANYILCAGRIEELESLCEKLDCYGLSTVTAPDHIAGMPDDDCAAFGEKARALGLTVGEVGCWHNLMTKDPDLRRERIETTRLALRKAELMGCGSVVTLVGGNHPSGDACMPHPTDPYMFSDDAKREFREIVLCILDGLALETTHLIIEPWNNTFFYQPEAIREFIDGVSHPMFGVHLDQMNMVSQSSYYNTTELINRTFDLLSSCAWSVHLKDILITCAPGDVVTFTEVPIGEGAMDYATYLKRLAELPPDTPCYCEHLATEAEFAMNFARLHHMAKKLGLEFVRRTSAS